MKDARPGREKQREGDEHEQARGAHVGLFEHEHGHNDTGTHSGKRPRRQRRDRSPRVDSTAAR